MQLATLLLVNNLLQNLEDFDLRVHNRSQMEKAGLRRIISKCRQFGAVQIDRQLDIYETLAEEDRSQLVKNYNEEFLRDMSDPYDVYRALMSSVEGTPAHAFLLSAMQHLLLIREDPEIRTRYFQLIDHLITSVVLDKKPGFKDGLSDTIGISVSRLVAQFGEQDRTQKVEDQLTLARSEITRLQLEKEALDEEVSKGGDGLVGELRTKLASAEERLRVARQNCKSLEGRILEQKRGYEEQIEQLETQIMELFRMIKENNVLEFLKSKDAPSEQLRGSEMITALQKLSERKKTFELLEGRTPRKGKARLEPELSRQALDEEEDYEDDGAEIVDASRTPQPRRTTKARIQRPKGPRPSMQPGDEDYEDDQASQFMDADDDNVRQHLERHLTNGAASTVSFIGFSNCDSAD